MARAPPPLAGNLLMSRFHKGNTRGAKLTATQVYALRQAYEGGATQGELARAYQLSVGQVARIVRGESWNAYNPPPPAPLSPAEIDAAARASQERMRLMMGDAPFEPA